MTRRYSLIALFIVSALLAACTMSLTGGTPTAIPNQSGQGVATSSLPGADATMFALGTSLAATQQSQQAGNTPQVPAQVATATPSQIPGAATATTAPVVATATPIVAAATQAPAAACTSPYTVQKGDWIYKIARACKLTPQSIIAANPGINANRLDPGQRLNLPGGVPPAATTQAPTTACKGAYTVKAGDNLFRIGYNCGFTTAQMAIRNNIAAPYRIFPGQVLQYP
ncbi:MAG: LysM peptidoglycan-binding domain-containing protein [Anaerolineales bacterium]